MHEQLDKYLAQVEKQLASLPAEQRDAELREIRLHLQMMIEDFMALGDSEEEAVAAALRQFGASHKVGRDLIRARKQEQREKGQPFWAARAVVGVYGMRFAFQIWLSLAVHHLLETGAFISAGYLILNALCNGVPFAAGVIAAKLAPRQVFPVLLWTHAFLIGGALLGLPDNGSTVLMLSVSVPVACLGAAWQQRRTKDRDQSTLMPSD